MGGLGWLLYGIIIYRSLFLPREGDKRFLAAVAAGISFSSGGKGLVFYLLSKKKSYTIYIHTLPSKADTQTRTHPSRFFQLEKGLVVL